MSEQRFTRIWAIVRAPFFAFIALTNLLALTTAVAFVPLGSMNLIVSLTIATAKVAIIAIVFMELEMADGVNRLASMLGVFWLAILFLLVFSDYLTR